MATDKDSIFVNGGNGRTLGLGEDSATQEKRARAQARRYRRDFVDLRDFHIQHELFRTIPVDLMFAYNFVPLGEQPDGTLLIAVADPSQLVTLDEISLRLGRRIQIKVATLNQITDILK